MKSKIIYKNIILFVIYICVLGLLLILNSTVNKNFIEAMTSNNVIFLKSIDTINISETFTKIINNKYVVFYSSNSSIIDYPGKSNTYALNIRFINYSFKNGVVHIIDNHPVISINKLLIMNKKFEIEDHNQFDNNLHVGSKYIGLEDLRLYNQNGQLYYSATCYDNYSDKMKISNNMYNIKSNSLDLVPNIINVKFETKFITEKNWVYFDYLNETHLIYQWYPLKICKIINGNELTLIETKKMPQIFESSSGSSGGILYDNKYWFIIHKRDKSIYFHRFVCFDSNMNLIKYSSPFHFQTSGIEFTLSFIIEEDRVIIPYTVEDTKLYIGIYDKNYILNNLNYISV